MDCGERLGGYDRPALRFVALARKPVCMPAWARAVLACACLSDSQTVVVLLRMGVGSGVISRVREMAAMERGFRTRRFVQESSVLRRREADGAHAFSGKQSKNSTATW